MSTIEFRIAQGVTVDNFVQAAAEGQVTFYRQRGNGSTRRLQFLAEGTTDRETAEWVMEQRDAGRTMQAIAREISVSVPTLRRMINALLLTEEVEEYDADDIAEILDGLEADEAEADAPAVTEPEPVVAEPVAETVTEPTVVTGTEVVTLVTPEA